MFAKRDNRSVFIRHKRRGGTVLADIAVSQTSHDHMRCPLTCLAGRGGDCNPLLSVVPFIRC